MMSYKTYNTYKESDIHWAMKIPKNWNISKLKRIFQFEKGKNSNLLTEEYVKSNDGPYPVYSGQTKNNGVLGSIDSYEYDFKNNVILVTTVGAKAMTTFLINGKLSLSQNCALIKLKSLNDFSDYYYYLCKILFNYERGLIPDIMQPSLRIGDLNTYNIIKPPLEEQQQIAKYLDKQIAKIDTSIAKNNELIQLLEEKSAALINQVVTKGLNPDAPRKYSGIEWIGKIPEYWKIAPLKRFVKLHNGKEIKNEVEEDDENAIGVYGSGGLFKYTDEYLFKGESVLFGRKGTLGKPLYLNDTFWTVDTMYYLSFNKYLLPKYCYYYLTFYPWDKISTETAKPSVVGSDVTNSMFAIPNITEQKQIVEYLDAEIIKINQTITKIQENINLLEEYKTSLIHNVVTGKIDVREEVI